MGFGPHPSGETRELSDDASCWFSVGATGRSPASHSTGGLSPRRRRRVFGFARRQGRLIRKPVFSFCGFERVFPVGARRDSFASLERTMRPKPILTSRAGETDMLRNRLDDMIDMRREPAPLAGRIDWKRFDEAFGTL